MTTRFVQFAAVCLLFGCGANPPTALSTPAAPEYKAVIVNTFPHDARAFTQGLIYHDGALYESTGIYGKSSLRKAVPETGEIVNKILLPRSVFAEGLALVSNRLIQITWHSELGYVYDAGTFDLLKTFSYKGEGWGICYDGSRLIMSDGSASLRFFDPVTFEQQGVLEVTDGGKPVIHLNELEYVEGLIYANVWQSFRIACIHPETGAVVRWINCESLRPRSPMMTEDVLNGIAWDAERKRLFVTGKLWNVLYEITSENCSGTESASAPPAPAEEPVPPQK